MNILIVEDEIKTAKALARLLQSVRADIRVADIVQSVEGTVSWLRQGMAADIIFMDIQLADGSCFEIFKAVEVTIPVIFCTAFSEYTFQAFKNNGIDYILKPFTKKDIENALNKVEQLGSYFQRIHNANSEILTLIKSVVKEHEGKTSFLVFKQNRYVNILTTDICYFFKGLSGVCAVTGDGIEYPVKESLDELQRLLSPADFYRINRQYLIAFRAIKEVQHYFDRKLWVDLLISTNEKLIVGREKSTSFLDWLGDR